MDLPVLKTIIRTFLEVFPSGLRQSWPNTASRCPSWAWWRELNPCGTPLTGWSGAPGEDKLRNGLEKVQLRDSLALFGLFMGGSDDLRAFAGPGPLNTDDRPVW